MRVVLDTSALWVAHVWDDILAQPQEYVLPAIAFAERARQYAERGVAVEVLWARLQQAGIVVEAMGAVEASRYFAKLPRGRLEALGRDAFIAGHVGPDDVLWTSDVDDFIELGVPLSQVILV